VVPPADTESASGARSSIAEDMDMNVERAKAGQSVLQHRDFSAIQSLLTWFSDWLNPESKVLMVVLSKITRRRTTSTRDDLLTSELRLNKTDDCRK